MFAYSVSSGQNECLKTNTLTGLPPFMGYPGLPEERIHHQHQAIIPTYKFTCCGNITEWGVDLNPLDIPGVAVTFDFDLQMWRPSSTVSDDGSGCYSLVGNYAVRSISIDTLVTADHVARVTPSVQLQFQPGDVLGFYVESQASITPEDNGVVLLDNEPFTSERVWYASITSKTSLSGNCPYSVGRGGVLNTLTRAAPVISISTSVYSCPKSLSTVVSVTPTSTFNPENNNLLSSTYLVQITPTTLSTATPGVIITTDSALIANQVPLIAGSLVTLVVVCILLILMIIVAITVVRKYRTNKAAFSPEVKTGMEDVTEKDIKLEANPVYEEAKLKSITAVEVNPSYEQVVSATDIKVAANPSYEQVGTGKDIEVSANPSYEQVGTGKDIEVAANPSYEKLGV